MANGASGLAGGGGTHLSEVVGLEDEPHLGGGVVGNTT